jgi:hypothetical protein
MGRIPSCHTCGRGQNCVNVLHCAGSIRPSLARYFTARQLKDYEKTVGDVGLIVKIGC